jgi:hypothetical protein
MSLKRAGGGASPATTCVVNGFVRSQAKLKIIFSSSRNRGIPVTESGYRANVHILTPYLSSEIAFWGLSNLGGTTDIYLPSLYWDGRFFIFEKEVMTVV